MFFKKKEKESAVFPHQITFENFDEVVLNTEKPVVIDFWASWCAPCKVMNPIIQELAEEYDGKAVIGKVNTEHERQLSAKFEIRSIPTIVVIHKGVIVEHINGVAPKPVLKRVLDELI